MNCSFLDGPSRDINTPRSERDTQCHSGADAFGKSVMNKHGWHIIIIIIIIIIQFIEKYWTRKQ